MPDIVNLRITKFIKRTTPSLYFVLKRFYWFSRKQMPVTKLLGQKWERSRKLIEIYITYHCNLKCYNCDVSCRQAPSQEQMTIEQIKKFIEESVASNVKWEKIRVMGGEPTLHPDILEMLDLLLEYKKSFSPSTRIQLITNGFGKVVDGILPKVPEEIEIENSQKKTVVQAFTPFNLAPKDDIFYKFADYSNGCQIISGCGIGLTPYGYYCCGIAGSIDRVFGFDLGRKTLPSSEDKMVDQLQTFCKYCGHFIYNNPDNKKPIQELMSPSWEIAYGKFKRSKAILSLYQDDIVEVEKVLGD